MGERSEIKIMLDKVAKEEKTTKWMTNRLDLYPNWSLSFDTVTLEHLTTEVTQWYREQSADHEEEKEIVEEYRKSSAKAFESPYGMTEHVKRRDELIERLGKLRLNELLMNGKPQRTGGR